MILNYNQMDECGTGNALDAGEHTSVHVRRTLEESTSVSVVARRAFDGVSSAATIPNFG